MRERHVGALLVKDGPEVVGVVTDRDLVVHGLAASLDPATTEVGRVMSLVVASVPQDAEVLEALERMRGAGVRRLLVTDGRGAAAGFVSVDDIVDGLAAELASASALMRSEIRREAVEVRAQPRS